MHVYIYAHIYIYIYHMYISIYVGDADKVKLQEEADKLKAQYEKKKLEYEEAVPEVVRKDRQLAIKKKKAGKPAKVCSKHLSCTLSAVNIYRVHYL